MSTFRIWKTFGIFSSFFKMSLLIRCLRLIFFLNNTLQNYKANSYFRRMKYILLSLALILSFGELSAQTTVQTFNFNSPSRDTVITFPTQDHNDYEKILMHYGMRCKDALVSTGADRNRGCGEWDYSCNTYIVDSTRVDSTIAVAPNYVIGGFSGDVFNFRNDPTYTYYQTTQRQVAVTGTENTLQVVPAMEDLDVPLGGEDALSITYLLKADDLLNSNVTTGALSGLKLPVAGEATFEDLRIELAATSNIDITETMPTNWQQVYYADTELSSTSNNLYFYENYEWDGFENIMVRMSYSGAVGSGLSLRGQAQSYEALSYTRSAYKDFIEFGSSGYIQASSGLDEISQEITISFWQNGSDILPTSTSILEAKGPNELRQINIHHPWGNGQIYWDCGNDGSGYDRINKTAEESSYKNQWNHWAFTKNATTGSMKIYHNGVLWHSGTGKTKAINATAMNIGRAILSNTLISHSQLSEFRIWNKELDAQTITSYMHQPVTDTHPDYDALVMYYSMDKMTNGEMEDLSGKGNTGTVVGQVAFRPWSIEETVMTQSTSSMLPAQFIDQADYSKNITEVVTIDSLVNLPSSVSYYVLEGTDRNLESTQFLYAAGTFPILDEEGNSVGEVDFAADGTINVENLTYYNKAPMAFEIMSFVTPYGIGLDFGEEGRSWTFDVTDYGPILKGDKRMYMSRGGEFQEEMDIWFEFIEGEPAREVVDINQVWQVQSSGHAAITANTRLEPRPIRMNPEATFSVLKTTITGHGQQGEFEPRQHVMTASNSQFNFQDSWSVWTECADNPIHPQGGTWVYDRAGWCPGAASDTREYDLTQFLQNLDDLTLDYSIPIVAGTSNYIVNSQLVEYGDFNRANDLAVEDVIYPSNKVEHSRHNPSCQAPLIMLKNYGSERITSATIEYGIVGRNPYTYTYTGNLSSLRTEEVELNFISDLLRSDEEAIFYAEVKSVNGVTDEYANNNSYLSEVTPVPHYESEVVLEFKTNFATTETIYRVYDENGSTVHGVTSGLQSNTVFRDTLRGLQGCYQILIEDFGEDGLSWWANNDGDGYFRMRNIGGSTRVIEPDFGSFFEFNFTAGMVTSTDDLAVVKDIEAFPNPTTDKIHIAGLEDWDNTIQMAVTDQLGHLITRGEHQKSDLDNGINTLSTLDNGIYYITLSDSDKTSSLRVVKI